MAISRSAGVAAFLFASIAYADGFGIFSEHEKLKGHAIVDAGDIERIEIRSSSGFGPKEFLKLGGRCYEPIFSLPFWSYGKKAGLVLVDSTKSGKIALLENGIGSVDVKVIPVTQVGCASVGDPDGPQDTQQRLLELRRKQEELQRRREETLRQLEELKKRQQQ
jgi:hypothetical protein